MKVGLDMPPRNWLSSSGREAFDMVAHVIFQRGRIEPVGFLNRDRLIGRCDCCISSMTRPNIERSPKNEIAVFAGLVYTPRRGARLLTEMHERMEGAGMPGHDIQVNPLSERGFFAEVVGADLRNYENDAQFDLIKAAHLAHGVIVIRDQEMTPAQQIAFSRRFGPLAIHVLEDQLLEGHPEILLVSNKTKDGKYVGLPDAGRYWHTDQSYEPKPALGSFLLRKESSCGRERRLPRSAICGRRLRGVAG